jgi:hypothetical protein
MGWVRKNQGLVSQQVWHDKDPSLPKGLAGADDKPKFCRVRSTSPKVLESRRPTSPKVR